MLRVITVNVNGIRAAARKNFFPWLLEQDADVVCLQETKAQEHQLADDLYRPDDYHCYYFDAVKKGYSGVAIYSKHKPDEVNTGLGWPIADTEGRYIEVRIGNYVFASIYFPSGSSGDERQAIKYEFLDHYYQHMLEQRKRGYIYVLSGDWNIAHKKIDIKNWRGNQKNSGFLPEERAWMDKVFDEADYVDAFRQVDEREEQYTWWSNRGRAWDNNVGWRLDYQVVSPELKDKVLRASIYKDERFSDHAPLIIDYDVSL